eukprot:2397976-Prymnesium_polylepis.1
MPRMQGSWFSGGSTLRSTLTASGCCPLPGTNVPSNVTGAGTNTLRLWDIRLPPIADISKLPLAIRCASNGMRSDYKSMFLDVQNACHRSEVAVMLAFTQAGYVVDFPEGNQGVVDCLLDGVSTQVKTHNIGNGSAPMVHYVKGKRAPRTWTALPHVTMRC